MFVKFLKRRKMQRHFRPMVLLHTFLGHEAHRDVAAGLSGRLRQVALAPPDDVLASLHSSRSGINERQAAARRRAHGANQISHEKPMGAVVHFLHCYGNPFNLLLTLLAGVSWATHDARSAVVILLMVMLSTTLRFWQEGRSSRAADALKAMVSNSATVVRPGKPPHEVDIVRLVPGDVVSLSAGDMIPADCRVISCKDLFVSQSAMTGESMPVEKFAEHAVQESHNPLALANIVFMGTDVVSGTATVVVVSTGAYTYFGALADRVTSNAHEPTAFQVGVNKVSTLLIRFMLVMSPLVFLINGLTKGDWLESLLFALSVSVGMTPEMLPMVVTSTLAKGAVALARKKVIVKRLDAIQNFGAMDVLCTDKTGTLTQDRICLSQHVDCNGDSDLRVLELAYVNSHFQTGLKNMIDVAVLQRGQDIAASDTVARFEKIDEVPFDFSRRRMSVVVRETGGHAMMITKGAVEEVLAVCCQVRVGEAIHPLTPDRLVSVRDYVGRLNGDGLRVVAVAVRAIDATMRNIGVAKESGLTLEGFMAFLDPPKETTAPALEALASHGIDVKVLTGDNPLVTARICQEVGLRVSRILMGDSVETLDDAVLAIEVERYNVFAKLTPLHKERIVRALRGNGHVVGFMGDGINDAPALRAADIGISVDSAVDIAKEAADIILLEKSLLVLDEGVLEGRRTFVNMLKYIKMTASSNFGNVFSVLIASVFIPFLPMLPMHLLVQNLLYDISQGVIPFDNVDEEMLLRPLHWNPAGIGRFMLFFGPLSSLFDVLTFALMWFVFAANSPAVQTLFQSGWFVVGLVTQTLVVHLIRTARLPFVESRPAPALVATSVLILALGIYLPMGRFAPYFGLQALPLDYFAWLPLIVSGYMVLVQVMKGVYRRRWGWQ